MTAFATADLCDAHEAHISVCRLPLRSFGGKRSFCGPIATVYTRADAGIVRHCVMRPGHGQVLVIDGQGITDAAVFGDKLGAHAVRNGWAGIVVNGVVRDTQALALMDLGVLALGTSPQRGWLEGEGKTGVTLELGSALFAPGSYAYCDPDGVIVSRTALHEQAPAGAG